MSIGISEKQTWGMTVYLVCVCVRAGGASNGAEEIFSEIFPCLGRRKRWSLFCRENLQQYSSPFVIQQAVLASLGGRCCSWHGTTHTTLGGLAASFMLPNCSAAAKPKPK